MTIRMGNQASLASREMLLIERDPVDIVSFTELQILVQRHRAEMQGESREGQFLLWLMEREGNRLASSDRGERELLGPSRDRLAGFASGRVALAHPAAEK